MKKIVLFMIVILSIISLNAVCHKIGEYVTPSANYITFVNNIAYLAGLSSGLKILDISNPENPVLISSYNAFGGAYAICIENDIAYVAYGQSGIRIFDISNPQDVRLLGSYITPHNSDTYSLTINDNIAYLADGYYGFRIVNVSNPQNPVLISSYVPYSNNSEVHEVVVSNNILI